MAVLLITWLYCEIPQEANGLDSTRCFQWDKEGKKKTRLRAGLSFWLPPEPLLQLSSCDKSLECVFNVLSVAWAGGTPRWPWKQALPPSTFPALRTNPLPSRATLSHATHVLSNSVLSPKSYLVSKTLPSQVLGFFLFRAAPVAHGGSQARGWIGAAAACLHHSHSNMSSERRLRPTPQLTATLDP